jgi:hypothetical protein
MELFFPSVIVLLLAAAVVFFVFPRFGPATLAIISAVLLAFGLYQHYTTFGTEYRFSTWQLVSFAPYLLVGGLLVVIAIFLLYTLPVASAVTNAGPLVNLPSVDEMPPANTSTNMLTSGINKTLNTAANLFNAGTNKNNNNSIINNIGNYIPGFNNKDKAGRNKGLNFPFSQV